MGVTEGAFRSGAAELLLYICPLPQRICVPVYITPGRRSTCVPVHLHDPPLLAPAFCLSSAGPDPLSNLGSLKNDLLIPSGFANKGHDTDNDDPLDDLMLLGTTPNLGSTPTFNQRGAVRGAGTSGALPGTSGPGTSVGGLFSNGVSELLRGLHHHDDDDELMGMSPDIPSMIRSPDISSPGFDDFMRKAFATGPVASAASLNASPLGQPPSQQGPPSNQMPIASYMLSQAT